MRLAFVSLVLIHIIHHHVLADVPLELRNVNIGVTTYVDMATEDWITYSLIDFYFGPNFEAKEGWFIDFSNFGGGGERVWG